jgi:hypothetical protein
MARFLQNLKHLIVYISIKFSLMHRFVYKEHEKNNIYGTKEFS